MECVLWEAEDGIVDVESFFFQAEDGIRDVERSRGLGDVYKSQYGSPCETSDASCSVRTLTS